MKLQRLEKAAQINNLTPEEMFDQLKDTTSLTDVKSVGGQFTNKNKVGAIKNVMDIKGREKQMRSIDAFAGSRQDEGELSEREDEDIYAHYMEQMRKAKLEEA